MLRISELRSPGRLVLKLEGVLSGETAPELDACWQTALATGEYASAWIDLSDVWRVDAAGWTVLGRLHRAGARFVTRGCLMRELIRENLESESCVN